MNRVKTYLELIRYPLFGIPIAATLPGALIASEGKMTWRVAAALTIALFGYFAGMIKNDYFHRETDAFTNPQRPLPSNRLTPKQALVPASVIYALCVLCGFLLNVKAGLLVMALVAISHLYNAFFKARGDLRKYHIAFGNWVAERIRCVSCEWECTTVGLVCFRGDNTIRHRYTYYNDI